MHEAKVATSAWSHFFFTAPPKRREIRVSEEEFPEIGNTFKPKK